MKTGDHSENYWQKRQCCKRSLIARLGDHGNSSLLLETLFSNCDLGIGLEIRSLDLRLED